MINCMCSDPECRINGCRTLRLMTRQTYEHPQGGIMPKGCVCPPGSEQTCQRSDCGRKDFQTRTYGTSSATGGVPQ